jgi:Glycosyltransferase family 87
MSRDRATDRRNTRSVSSAAGSIPFRARPWVRGLLLVLAVVGAGLGLLLGIEVLILHLTTDPLADVHAYYDAGTRLNAGLPLYVQTADPNFNYYYFYPPLLAIAFRPLALLPFEAAAIVWEALMLGATVLTVRRIGIRGPVLLAACWLALPILWALAIGQAQALVTLLLAYGTPFGVALAANVKIFPGLAAIYWVRRREWRRLGRFAAWMVAIVVFQLVLEPADTVGYLTFLRTDLVANVQNLSLYAVSPVLWGVSVAIMALIALRFANTRWGWPAAVVLSVFATPRLLSYQLSTLMAAFRPAEADGSDDLRSPR